MSSNGFSPTIVWAKALSFFNATLKRAAINRRPRDMELTA
jgi:hypothetical protein